MIPPQQSFTYFVLRPSLGHGSGWLGEPDGIRSQDPDVRALRLGHALNGISQPRVRVQVVVVGGGGNPSLAAPGAEAFVGAPLHRVPV